MATYVSSSISNVGAGRTPSPSTPAFAHSSPPASPVSSSGKPPIADARSSSGPAAPVYATPQLATPSSSQPYSPVSTSGGPTIARSPPAGPLPGSSTPAPHVAPP